MLAPLYPVRDLRLSGQVIHVGRSSMEIAVRMETLNKDGSEETVMLGTSSVLGCAIMVQQLTRIIGRFCMVCRDSGTHKAAPINPLLIETHEDEALQQIGEGSSQLRLEPQKQHLSSNLQLTRNAARQRHFDRCPGSPRRRPSPKLFTCCTFNQPLPARPTRMRQSCPEMRESQCGKRG